MRIKNKISLRRHREQLERAFEAYQERQSNLSPILNAEERRLSRRPHIPRIHSEHPTSAPAGPAGSSSNVDTPQLTYEGTTPVDLSQAILTPEPHETVPLPIASEDAQLLEIPVTIREGDKNDDWSRTIPITHTKRRAPSDFDEGSASSRFHDIVENTSQKQDILQGSATSDQYFSLKDGQSRSRLASTLPCVEEEPSGSKANKSKEVPSKITTISGLEGYMGVPPGFISFVKFGLTKSRWSIQSAISRASWRKASISLPVEPESNDESNPFINDQHMSSPVKPHAQSTTIQPTDPAQLYLGPQRTNLFLELQLAGATDQEIADRLHDLLEKCGPRAQQVVQTRGPCGEIPLEIALKLGNIPACKVLIDFGADVNAKTSDGSSLREFGAKAQKNTDTSQQYYAIGACRNALREDRSTENLVDASKKRAKLSDKRPQEECTSAGVNNDSEQSNVPDMFPSWSISKGQDSILSNPSHSTHQSRQEHVWLRSQQTDTLPSQNGSPQDTPRPAVAELVRHFNQGSQPPPFYDSRKHSLSGLGSSSQSRNSFKGVNAIPASADTLGALNGHWEFLSDNRRAFILDDSPDVPVMQEDTFPHMAFDQDPYSDTRNCINNNAPFPTTQNGVGSSNHESSSDARRYGMASVPWSYKGTMMPPEISQSHGLHPSVASGIVVNDSNTTTALWPVTGETMPLTALQAQSVQQPNVLDSAFHTQLDNMRVPWPLPNAAMQLSSTQPQETSRPGVVETTNTNEWDTLQTPSNIDNRYGYSSHPSAPTPIWNFSSSTETYPQSVSTNPSMTAPNTLESDINEIFFGDGSNAKFVPEWDWQRYDTF